MRPQISEFQAINVSSTTDIATIDMLYHTSLTYQVNFLGTLEGTLRLYLSNDGVTFFEFAKAAKVIPSGNNSYLFDLVFPCTARYFKITMDVTSGLGDIFLTASLKGASSV